MPFTEHFSREEMMCHCGCEYDACDPSLLAGLEILRANIGKPITVTSGTRCPLHNQKVGGEPGSYHVKGQAADIQVAGMTARNLYMMAYAIPQFRGFGVDDQRAMLHVDTRAVVARWCYRNGKQAPWGAAVSA